MPGSPIYSPASLAPLLSPFRLYYAPRMRSTNDHAAALRRSRRLYAPAIVLTSHQLAGRGRGSNTWWSGRGTITVTFCLPADKHIPPHHVPLLAGLAVREALVEIDPALSGVRIKWPNDLWHDDLKLAGLLCERMDHVDLVGLGLNVDVDRADVPKSLRHRVTSVRAIAGRAIGLSTVLVGITKQIRRRLLHRGDGGETFAQALREINRVHALTGRSIRVSEPGTTEQVVGMCEGLDADGRLLLRTDNGLHPVVAGSVELL